MKIALLGDTHFGVRNDNPFFYEYFDKFYNQFFFPYLEQNYVDYVIQLGDLFDRRKHINFLTLKHAQETFLNTLNQRFKSWILVGNHDSYFKNTIEVNSLQLLLKNYTNIHGIISPYETSINGAKILFIPWVCEKNKEEVENALKISKSNIVVGHFEFAGFEMYKGIPNHTHAYVDIELFKKFEFVFSGHYHHKSTKDNIHYLGTPYEMVWSDYDDEKGFHIFNTSTQELEFVKNPYQIFHKVFYDDKNEDMTLLDKFDFSFYRDTFVKVVVVNKTNPYLFDMFIEKLEKNNVYNISVVDDHLQIGYSSEESILASAEDTVSILSKQVQQVQDNIDKKKLEQLVVGLYHEAVNIQ
jgi:DNA repair exonuclease SbcCD nuclease subunit